MKTTTGMGARRQNILSAVALSIFVASIESFCLRTTPVPRLKMQGKSFLKRDLRAFSTTESSSSSTIKITDGNTTTNEAAQNSNPADRVAVIVCPAQFCVPEDYIVLEENLKSFLGDDKISTVKVAPLPRTEWIKVAKQLPTKNFLDATLPVYKTLDWYFEAIEKAISEAIAEEGTDVNLCLVGHSIGGWVARAYLGGLAKKSTAVERWTNEKCTSLITLGTPHISPDSALVDQTRGLLREIDETQGCCTESLKERGIDITCVCSSGLSGNLLTTNVEELVAATSYLPLLGRLGNDVVGDGIVPLDLAFMQGSRRITIEKCSKTGEAVRHSHVLPTPYNLWNGYAPSIKLPGNFVSYVSEGVIHQWAQYIR